MNARMKLQKNITFKGDGITTCRCCETKLRKLNSYGEACSSSCAKEVAELKAIPLPATFIISLLNRTKTAKERESQLQNFIKMHDLDERKVILKYNQLVTQIKREGLDSIKRKSLKTA